MKKVISKYKILKVWGILILTIFSISCSNIYFDGLENIGVRDVNILGGSIAAGIRYKTHDNPELYIKVVDILGNVNDNLNVSTGVIKISDIIKTGDLGIGNAEVVLLIDCFRDVLGGVSITTPGEYRWILSIIKVVHDKLVVK